MSYVQLANDQAARQNAERDEYYRLAHTELYELAMALRAMPKSVRRNPDFASEVLWSAVCLFTSDEQEQEWAEAWVLEYLRDV